MEEKVRNEEGGWGKGGARIKEASLSKNHRGTNRDYGERGKREGVRSMEQKGKI